MHNRREFMKTAVSVTAATLAATRGSLSTAQAQGTRREVPRGRQARQSGRAHAHALHRRSGGLIKGRPWSATPAAAADR